MACQESRFFLPFLELAACLGDRIYSWYTSGVHNNRHLSVGQVTLEVPSPMFGSNLKESLSEQAYHHIRNKIVSGELPRGSQVSEIALANELGFSRTPVREAIRRLVQEELVEQVPRFGTIVRTHSRREISETYDIREALECYAIVEAARLIDEHQLQQLQRLCEEIDGVAKELEQSGQPALDARMMRRFMAADMAFHVLIIRTSRNRRMEKMVMDMRIVTRFFGLQRAPHDLDIVRLTYRDHLEILAALRERDSDKARALLSRHSRTSKEQTLNHYDQQRELQDEALETPPDLPGDVLEELPWMNQASA